MTNDSPLVHVAPVKSRIDFSKVRLPKSATMPNAVILRTPIHVIADAYDDPRARQHIIDKFGPYWLEIMFTCATSAPLCKPGKRRSRCGRKVTEYPGRKQRCLAEHEHYIRVEDWDACWAPYPAKWSTKI